MTRRISLIWLCSLLIPSLSSPFNAHDTTNVTDSPGTAGPSSLLDQDAHGTSIMVSWLWGLVWGDDSTVTVVDRTPVLNFNARPAAFGAASDVLGYLIRVEDFSVPCDEDGDDVEHHGQGPWWPGGGSEWEIDPSRAPNRTAGRQHQNAEKQAEYEWKLKARHGCPRLCVRGKDRPQSSETWMALVMRGGCTFVEKVREAQRFGAKGVVVGGETEAQDRHGDGLVQMFSLGDSSDIQIPSTYITHDSYITLSSLIASSNTSIFGLRTVSVGIVTDPSGWEWYSPLLTFLILLFLPSSLTLCTLLVHRVRAARAAQRERAPEDVVQNLPWRVWEGQQTLWELEKTFESVRSVSEEEVSNVFAPREDAIATTATRDDNSQTRVAQIVLQKTQIPHCEPSTSSPRNIAHIQLPSMEVARKWYEMQVECAICLEDFVKGDKVRVLPCRHIFHMEEIDDWLIRRKKLCPICKHDVTRPPYSSSGSDLADHPGSQTVRNGDEPPTLSTIYEEDTDPTERTPLLQRPNGR